jgi:electron transfer flavoprotein beta subunit
MLTAAALALVLRDEAPELVLCGVLSSDSGHGATGSALAGLLDLPYAAAAMRIQVDGGAAVVDRELEGGLVEMLEVTLPAVISVQTGINEPRYVTLRSMQEARGADLRVVENGAAAQPASHIQRMFIPAHGEAVMLEGGPSELAQSILEIVRREVE